MEVRRVEFESENCSLSSRDTMMTSFPWLAQPLTHIAPGQHLDAIFPFVGAWIDGGLIFDRKGILSPFPLETRKASAILEKAKAFLPDETIPVEIEYEDKVISQYTIEGHESRVDSVILRLAHKHTECLAPELCKVPVRGRSQATSCYGPSGCC